ncbi:MAG TPA: 3-deoxy-D-manno-octulosonic acid transferase [Thermoguttaceae bacterium]
MNRYDMVELTGKGFPSVPYLLNVFYLLLIIFALPWLVWQAIFKGKYRQGYAAKLFGLVPARISNKPCLWLHAVSVGEVNLLAPLIRQIKEKMANHECVISTTTATGMELAKKKFPDLMVFYCPLDFTWAVSTAVCRIRPDVLVLAELELWPNLIQAAKKSGAGVAIINGRLSEKSFRGYQWIWPLVAKLLRQIDLIAVQNETYAKRFQMLGAQPQTVQVTGSMKYDGAQTDRNNPATQRLAALAGFTQDDVVFLAGSTQEPEEEIVLEIFRRLSTEFPRLRLVLVPRHPHRFDAVARLLDQSGFAWQRRTALVENPTPVGATVELSPQQKELSPQQRAEARVGVQLPPEQKTQQKINPRILLVDVVGELGAWWGTAQIAFVGGSFGRRGGQNMIEPAAYGAAVSFGPNTWNFSDIVSTMLSHDAAVEVADARELENFIRRCLKDSNYATVLGSKAQSLVVQQIGATARTLELLAGMIK